MGPRAPDLWVWKPRNPSLRTGCTQLPHGTNLWVSVVTFPTQELPDKRLILVHLGEADPAGKRTTGKSGHCNHAHVQNH